MDNSNLYEKSILLIGPSGIGKTTIAKVLSKKTGLEQLSLDAVANEDRRNGIRKEFPNRDDYNLYLLNKVIENAKKNKSYGIVDFGAGHSVFESEEKFIKAQELLGNFQNIILLQYSDDMDESLEVINTRSTGDIKDNFYFITNDCNTALATMVVYTKDKTTEDIAEEIIERMNNNSIKR